MAKVVYNVSKEPFTGKDYNTVFKTYTLPNGTIVKILNRRIHEEGLKRVKSHSQSVKEIINTWPEWKQNILVSTEHSKKDR